MLNAVLWLLGLVALGGVALGGFYLAERPIQGVARWGSIAHGMAGALGVGLAVAVLSGLADRQGFGRLSGGLLIVALAAGLVIAVAQVRRRRASGVVVAIHAVLGVAALVMLAAYASVG